MDTEPITKAMKAMYAECSPEEMNDIETFCDIVQEQAHCAEVGYNGEPGPRYDSPVPPAYIAQVLRGIADGYD